MMNRNSEKRAADVTRLMIEVFDQSAIGEALSVGYRVGLFEILANMPNSTAKQISAAARLNESQVREWLAKLVTGRVVDFDPRTASYSLPVEYAEFLTDRGMYNTSGNHFAPEFDTVGRDQFDTRSYPNIIIENADIHDTDCSGTEDVERAKPLFERDWEYFVVTRDPATGAYKTQTLCCDSAKVTKGDF